jgi:hypothetical protein
MLGRIFLSYDSLGYYWSFVPDSGGTWYGPYVPKNRSEFERFVLAFFDTGKIAEFRWVE